MKKIIFLFLLLSIPVFAGDDPPQIISGGSSTLNFLDDVVLSLGTGAPAKLLWETADANANALLITTPEGGATDIPCVIFGDATLVNLDIGLFNGLTDPCIAVMSDDGLSAIRFGHNQTNAFIGTTEGGIAISDEIISSGGLTISGVDTSTNQSLVWSAGEAVDGTKYLITRNADATNLLQMNVPTGASFELSVNDGRQLVLDSSAANFQDNTITTTATNAAGGSATAITIAPTLAAQDGSDTYKGISCDITNANHTGSGNIVTCLNGSNITGDAQSDEYFINGPTGYDFTVHCPDTGGCIYGLGSSVFRTVQIEALTITEDQINFPEALTIADNGAGTPASSTFTPTRSYIQVTCNDANGCNITLGESGITSGNYFDFENIGTNTVNFADSAGVSEIAGAFAAGQYDHIHLRYNGSAYSEIGRSNN